MYSVTIRDHIMIAHSFSDASFGDAARLHGATYIIDVTFFSASLNKQNTVVDIARASDILKNVLYPLRYRNLDDIDEFRDVLTTTEFIARYIHDRVKESAESYFSGTIRVTIGESHIAWASYETEQG